MMFRQKKKLRRVLIFLGLFLPCLVVFQWGISRLKATDIRTYHIENINPPLREKQNATVRIGVYNIAHGRGLSPDNWTNGEETPDQRNARLNHIGELLLSEELDVAVLNEVDFDSTWSHRVNQARVIAETGLFPYVVEVPNLDFSVVHHRYCFGNAILSRFPISDPKVLDLPGYSRLETILAGKKRGISVLVELPHGQVRIFGVHLSHRSESVRVAAARYIISEASGESVPVMIVGDMNSEPPGFPGAIRDSEGENAMTTFENAERWRRHPNESPGLNDMTFHSTAPQSVIDWILIPTSWSFESYEVGHQTLSDHRPVFASIRM